MFIEFFDIEGDPISISLLNIHTFYPNSIAGLTTIVMDGDTRYVVRGCYGDIRDQIRAKCK